MSVFTLARKCFGLSVTLVRYQPGSLSVPSLTIAKSWVSRNLVDASNPRGWYVDSPALAVGITDRLPPLDTSDLYNRALINAIPLAPNIVTSWVVTTPDPPVLRAVFGT